MRLEENAMLIYVTRYHRYLLFAPSGVYLLDASGRPRRVA